MRVRFGKSEGDKKMQEKILISHFGGIVLYLEKEYVNEEKVFYNILAKYKYSEAVYSFDGELMSGKIAKKQDTLARAWIHMREEELRAALFIWKEDNEILKIDGLK
jgi:hypothetical protein